mgnify:CR=1 FL=1
MNPEIEKLIDMALTDGVLTDKEREIILRKAEKLGEDIDEVEMILEGKMYDAQQGKKQSIDKQEQFITPQQSKVSSIHALMEKLQEVDNEITNPSSGKTSGDRIENTISSTVKTIFDNVNPVEVGVDAFKTVFGGTTSKDKERIEKQREELQRISLLHAKKATIINTFPLPDSRNELLEFANISCTNYKSLLKEYNEKGILEGEAKMMNSWKNKVEQIISKLKIHFSNDSVVLENIQELQNIIAPPKENQKKKNSWW